MEIKEEGECKGNGNVEIERRKMKWNETGLRSGMLEKRGSMEMGIDMKQNGINREWKKVGYKGTGNKRKRKERKGK